MSFRVASSVTAFAAAFAFGGVCAAGAQSQVQPSAPVLHVAAFRQPANWPAIVSATVFAEQIGPGVLYEHWKVVTAAGPLELSLATVDLRNPYVSLEVATQHDAIIGTGERLTSMADRLHAELGINADYFDITESGSPLNVVAANGRILHQPDSAATFVVDSHNHIEMGPMTWHARIASSSGVVRDLDIINEWSPSVSLALLTRELGTNIAAGAAEVVLVPAQAPGQYRVSLVDVGLLLLEPLAPGELGVAARGAEAESLVRDFHVGDAVTLTSQSEPAFDGIRLAVGGGPLLLKDGKLVTDPAPPAPEETEVRNPVTGAGISSDGNTLWLVVADGRAPQRSIGLTRPQLASLLAALGAGNAIAFDSGGSSEMVIRHLGDPASAVANIPSDGRERSVADGLFVLNTAPAGPLDRILLRPDAAAVLTGSNLRINVRAVDAHDQPVTLRPEDVNFRLSDPEDARVDRGGMLNALRPGSVQLTAGAFGVQGTANVRIVPVVDELNIVGVDNGMPVGGSVKLSVNAGRRDGEAVAVDPSTVAWSWEGTAARVLPDGTFVAGPAPARTVVTARVGGASASATVLSGDHPITAQAVPQPGMGAGQWHYSARPANLPGGVDGADAPDGEPALRLAYDFSAAQTTRAAYAESSLTLPGQPLGLSIDVYGDANGEWLRGGYRNADGNNESVTIARHVDWRGWRTIRAAIPRQAAWPIIWTRFYVVERSKGAREQGSLWFRHFQLFYAGPPDVATDL